MYGFLFLIVLFDMPAACCALSRVRIVAQKLYLDGANTNVTLRFQLLTACFLDM